MSNASKILIVDDDPEIREIVRVLLSGEGYATVEAASGEEALARLTPEVELVILDIMMPGLSGYSVCVKIRERSNVPILFLTAKNKDSDLTMGYSSGGDDYLAKPFSYGELLARVKGLLRRYRKYGGKPKDVVPSEISYGGIVLCTDRKEVLRDGKSISLTEKEYRILCLLLTNQGKLFSVRELYETVWEEPYYYSSSNTVMVHVRRLREKIEADPRTPTILKTVWGKGYRVD